MAQNQQCLTRQQEADRLKSEAGGSIFAPAKPGTFYAKKRPLLINEYVQNGLRKYDENSQEKLNEEKQPASINRPSM